MLRHPAGDPLATLEADLASCLTLGNLRPDLVAVGVVEEEGGAGAAHQLRDVGDDVEEDGIEADRGREGRTDGADSLESVLELADEGARRGVRPLCLRTPGRLLCHRPPLMRRRPGRASADVHDERHLEPHDPRHFPANQLDDSIRLRVWGLEHQLVMHL